VQRPVLEDSPHSSLSKCEAQKPTSSKALTGERVLDPPCHILIRKSVGCHAHGIRIDGFVETEEAMQGVGDRVCNEVGMGHAGELWR